MGIFDRFRIKEEKTNSGKALVVKPSYRSSKSEDNIQQSMSEREKSYRYYKCLYEEVPLVNAIVNVTSDQTVQDFYFEGPNMEKLEKWADKVNLMQFFHRMTKNMMIFGNAYAEVNKEGEEIVDLKILDPRWIDVYRTPVGEVIGYSQIIDNEKFILWGTTGDSQMDSTFKKRIAKIDTIVHFKFNVIGSDKYGISVIKPLVPSVQSKLQMENNLGSLLQKYVAPLIWAKIGSDEMPATSEVVQDIAGTLRDLHAESEIVTSHLVNLSVLDFENKGMDLKTPLEHVEQQIITGGQVPPILLNKQAISGDKGSEIQARAFGRRIKSIQRELKTEFEDKILVAFNMGQPEDKLVWTKAEEREWESDTDILRGLVTDGILTPQKANDLLPPRFREQLPDLAPMDENGMPTPRPTQRKQGKLIKDNPNDPTKTTKDEKSLGKRVSKSDKEIPA